MLGIRVCAGANKDVRKPSLFTPDVDEDQAPPAHKLSLLPSMAEAFPPFPIERTISNLTFYIMEGRNFVRKKSSLTRRKVLYSPRFKNTRHYAGLMAKASKIASNVYNALPEYWRQGWMYRSFTGEACKMIKAGQKEAEIQQVLLQRYVEPVISKGKPETIITLPVVPKRTNRKLNNAYWQRKTQKSIRWKTNKEQLMQNAGLLGRASKVGTTLYRYIPFRLKSREVYQQLTGWDMQLLKDEWNEADIIAELLPMLPAAQTEKCHRPDCAPGLIIHLTGNIISLPPCTNGSRPPIILPDPLFQSPWII